MANNSLSLLEELENKTHGMNIKELQNFLKDNIDSLEEKLSGNISIGFRDIKRKNPEFYINTEKPRWSASIIKIPVMIATMQKVDKNYLHLSDMMVIDHKYTLENYDPVSNMQKGSEISINSLLYYMITSSDNEATNMLIEKIGIESVNKSARKLGTKKTMLSHLLAYNVPRITSSWNPDGSNLTTAEDMTKLLYSIYTYNAASHYSCEYMKSILEESMAKPLKRFLPKDTIVGSKIGVISDPKCGIDSHDVGVINGDYVLSIMCSKIKNDSLPIEDFDEGFVIDVMEDLTKSRHYIRTYVYDNTSIVASEIISSISRIIYNAYYKSMVHK